MMWPRPTVMCTRPYTSVFNAMKRIEADVAPSEVRDNIMRFINDCKLRIVAIPRDLE